MQASEFHYMQCLFFQWSDHLQLSYPQCYISGSNKLTLKKSDINKYINKKVELR